MKNDHDQDLQKLLEETGISGSTPEDQHLKAYQQLYIGLSQPPGVKLRPDFADHVVQQAMRLKSTQETSYWWVALALVLSLGLSGIILYYIDFNFLIMLMHWLSSIKTILLFGGMMWLLIQIADYWLVKKISVH